MAKSPLTSTGSNRDGGVQFSGAWGGVNNKRGEYIQITQMMAEHRLYTAYGLRIHCYI
jgi:S-formylglutathione hydrolase FrmB